MPGRLRWGLICTARINEALIPPIRASERAEGNYWTYGVTTTLDGINMTGTLTYRFLECENLTTGGDKVNVMTVTGSISGSGDIQGITVSITGAYSGLVHEAVDSMGIFKDETTLWANISRGTGQYLQTDSWKTYELAVYDPPQGAGLVPGEVELNDSWTETIDETTMSTSWVNGVIEHEQNETTVEVEYSYSVAPSMMSVDSDAGTFDCYLVNVTSDDSEDLEANWYNEDVGNFVKMSTYENGEDTPSFELVLESYSYELPEDNEIVAFVTSWLGIVLIVVIVAFVIIAVALSRRGR